MRMIYFTISVLIGTCLCAQAEAEAEKKILTFGHACNVAYVTSRPDLKNIWAYDESMKKNSCVDVIGTGTLGRGTYNGITSQWLSFALYNGLPNEQDLLVIQYPLVTGGTFLYYETVDGKAVKLTEQDTYTVQSKASPKANGRSIFHMPAIQGR